MQPETPPELYQFIFDSTYRADRRGDWRRPGTIADAAQRHVLGAVWPWRIPSRRIHDDETAPAQGRGRRGCPGIPPERQGPVRQ